MATKRKNTGTFKTYPRNNTRRLLVFLIFLVMMLFLTFIFFIVRAHNSVLSVEEIQFAINVTDHVGFILDTDKLHFGGVFPGASSSRSIIVDSNEEGFVFVTSTNTDWIYVDRQGGSIGPNSSLTLEIKARPSKDWEHQNISGRVYVYIMTSNARWPFLFFKDDLLKSFDDEPPLGSKIKVNITG